MGRRSQQRPVDLRVEKAEGFEPAVAPLYSPRSWA
jgi:hypothetical protein